MFWLFWGPLLYGLKGNMHAHTHVCNKVKISIIVSESAQIRNPTDKQGDKQGGKVKCAKDYGSHLWCNQTALLLTELAITMKASFNICILCLLHSQSHRLLNWKLKQIRWVSGWQLTYTKGCSGYLQFLREESKCIPVNHERNQQIPCLSRDKAKCDSLLLAVYDHQICILLY